MQFIDSHSHIDFPEFDSDRIDAIIRAEKAGIKKIIVSATTEQRWDLIRVLADDNQIIAAAYGLHPMFTGEHRISHLDKLKTFISEHDTIAIGEIGLDYFISNPDHNAQLDLFIQQLDIATEFNLPVIIHARKSLDIILRELRKRPIIKGSIHSFSGSEQQARQLIDLGFYLGFGGPITYTRATKLRRLVSTLPLESILLETDSPDQPDLNHFGKRNEPAFLVNMAYEVAKLRGIEMDDLAEQIFNNTKQLFKL